MGGAQSMHVMNADGSDFRQIGRSTLASWSPDGSRIAFAPRNGGDYLGTMRPDGSDVRVLVKIRTDGSLFLANEQ